MFVRQGGERREGEREEVGWERGEERGEIGDRRGGAGEGGWCG